MKSEKNYNHSEIKNRDDLLLVANATADIYIEIEKAKNLCDDIYESNFTGSGEQIKNDKLETYDLVNCYPKIQSKLLILADILMDVYDELSCIQEVTDDELTYYRKRRTERYNLLNSDESEAVPDTSEWAHLFFESLNQVDKQIRRGYYE